MIEFDGRRVILLVEADEPLAHVAIAYLERDGYDVAHVGDLAAAAEMARDRPTTAPLSLVIVDLDSLDARERERLERRLAMAATAPDTHSDRSAATVPPAAAQAAGSPPPSPCSRLEAITSHAVMLLSSDPCPPRWLQRPDVTVLYKPFAMQELRQRIQRAMPLGGGTP